MLVYIWHNNFKFNYYKIKFILLYTLLVQELQLKMD